MRLGRIVVTRRIRAAAVHKERCVLPIIPIIRPLRVLWGAIIFVTFASSARGELIVVDPNEYSLGTDLSTMFAGLSMAHLSNQPNQDGVDGRQLFEPVASPVYAVSTYHAPTILSVGGMSRELLDYAGCSETVFGTLIYCSLYDVLELRFDSPTNFVQIDSRSFSDGPDILAYDALGNRIAGWGYGGYTFTATPADSESWASTITLSRDQGDIARIVYGGLIGNSTPTRITYSVPEPTTLGLMGLGVLGSGLFSTYRRRKLRRA